MKIPEPARRAWTDVLECVDEVFRTREGKRGWALHGGTLLAMRWDGHRESTDIDLLIGADAVTTLWEMVDGPRLAELDERLGRRGWTLLADRRNAWSRVYWHETGEGRIDLLRNEPRPTTGRRLERVEGEEIWCLSTAQVLAGNLIGRGPAAPVRDLYDVAVAARRMPQALARALDEVETPRLAAMLKGWLGAAQAYAARARVEIRGGKGRGHRGAAGGRGRDRVREVLDADLSGLAGRGRMENHGTGARARSESGVEGGRGRSATRPGGADAGRGEGEGGGGDGKRCAGRAGDGGYGESGRRSDGGGGTPSGGTETGGRVRQKDMAG